ncbi:IclR family transcriptional regulator [Duganella hordei]|uniref:IclR family transcriptional regulator n=1 Tax=Duganella hordei TaxID=2865934 RepID=UPI003341F8DD
MTEQTKSRRGIQSVEVGGKLLNALVDNSGPMTLSELARHGGMLASKAHPYLVSFCNLGLVEQDPVTGLYGLGPFAIQMGLVGLQQLSPIRLAIPEITKLADTLELTVALAVWGSHGPTITYIVESPQPVQIAMRPGSVMSLLGTATGLAFSAFMPPKLVQRMIEREVGDSAVLAQTKSLASQDKLDATLNEIRTRNMARVQNEPIPGVSALSAPVFNHAHSMVLAITVSGSSLTFDAGWDGHIAKALRETADHLSRVLGHNP